jgi:hypothetical protein
MRAFHAAVHSGQFRRALAVLGGCLAVVSSPSLAQTPVPVSPPTRPAPVSVELTACKSTALLALQERDAAIKDIFFDEDGITFADANTKVEDTPIRHIIMGEAYLQTNRQDKPRRFLCLIGEKGKVLLTFFTAR